MPLSGVDIPVASAGVRATRSGRTPPGCGPHQPSTTTSSPATYSLGVNLVTVGVFSWSRLQPEPGELTAGWLDRVLDLLAEARIDVDLATGTASPPPWLVAAHPEILPVTVDGRRLAPGARQHYCPSAPAFRAAAADLAARIARRYAGHPAVAMWHVGNEYGCHVPACYCELSAAAFRDWLRSRYGELGAAVALGPLKIGGVSFDVDTLVACGAADEWRLVAIQFSTLGSG